MTTHPNELAQQLEENREIAAEALTIACPECRARVGEKCSRLATDAPEADIAHAENYYGHPMLHFDRSWPSIKKRHPDSVWIFSRPEPA